MKHTLAALALSVVLLGCEQPTAPIERPTLAVGGAQVVHSQTATLKTTTFFNTCTGDEVSFEGAQITTETQVMDPAGGSRLVSIVRFMASAESDAGDQYRLVYSSSLSQVVSGDNVALTVPARVLLVGRRSGPVSTFSGVFLVTYVDNQLIVEFDTFESSGECWVATAL